MKKAVTLIELLIVVVLIGILGGIALVRYANVTEGARSAEAYSVLAQIVSAENVFMTEFNGYTANLDDLALDLPASENFTFSVPDIGVNSGYAQATHAGTNTQDYFMCLNGGQRGTTSCP